MALTIKRVESEDEAKGRAFVNWRSFKGAYQGIVDQDYLDNFRLEECEEKWRTAYKPIDHSLIAKDGEQVIGYVSYSEYQGDDLQNFGEVWALYILSDYYGKRVGYSLMQAALEQLKAYPKVALWVLKDNERAINFYKRCGFSFDGAEKILNYGSPVSAVRMIKQNS